MNIFEKSIIEDRKKKTAAELQNAIKDDEVVIVKSGEPIQMPGGHDQTYPFYPHPDYFWLTGYRRPKGISAFSKAEGWIDFVDPVTEAEKFWEGESEDLPGRNIADFESWLNNRKTITLAQGSNTTLDPTIQEKFNEIRRVKDSTEIDLIKKVANIANHGFQKIEELMNGGDLVGMTERDLQIEYESAVLRAGSHKLPYEVIIGSGKRSAVLHATPTSNIIKSNEILLVDAGADIQDYCVDITRSFPTSGKFESRHQAIYDIVLKAQTDSISLCTAGNSWSDVHLASAKTIAQGLRDLKILNTPSEDAIESGAIGLFLPHGVGHMVGLRVRDVGAPPSGEVKEVAGVRLRTSFNLREGYVMTVEPGLYFIEALLFNKDNKAKFKDIINWNELENWLDCGGVRLEDDILVKKASFENLTSIVKKL